MISHSFAHSPFVYPHLFSLFLSPALPSSPQLQRLLMRSGRQLPSRQRTSCSISTCIEFLHPVINSYWLLAVWDILLEHLNFEKLISVGQRTVLSDVLHGHMVRLQCWSVSYHALITWREGRGWCVKTSWFWIVAKIEVMIFQNVTLEIWNIRIGALQRLSYYNCCLSCFSLYVCVVFAFSPCTGGFCSVSSYFAKTCKSGGLW